jgi:gluconate kinase
MLALFVAGLWVVTKAEAARSRSPSGERQGHAIKPEWLSAQFEAQLAPPEARRGQYQLLDDL